MLTLFGVDLSDLSTGEWILIALALIGLPGIYWTAFVTHLLWRRKTTQLVWYYDTFTLECTSNGSIEVKGRLGMSPVGASFMVHKEVCFVTILGKRRKLRPVNVHAGMLYRAADILNLHFAAWERDSPLNARQGFVSLQYKLVDGTNENFSRLCEIRWK